MMHVSRASVIKQWMRALIYAVPAAVLIYVTCKGEKILLSMAGCKTVAVVVYLDYVTPLPARLLPCASLRVWSRIQAAWRDVYDTALHQHHLSFKDTKAYSDEMRWQAGSESTMLSFTLLRRRANQSAHRPYTSEIFSHLAPPTSLNSAVSPHLLHLYESVCEYIVFCFPEAS